MPPDPLAFVQLKNGILVPITSLAFMPYPQLYFAGSFLWKILESSNENSATLCGDK